MARSVEERAIFINDKLQLLFADETSKVFYRANELAYIAHFVVVPADGLNHLSVTNCDHLGLSSVEQRTE